MISSACLLIAGLCVFICIGGTVGDCVLPPHPAHGRHSPDPSECGGRNKHPACDGTPGTTAPENWLLYVHCNPGALFADPDDADAPSVCVGGSWSIPQLPTCVVQDASKDEERCTVPEAPPHAITQLLDVECEREDSAPGLSVPRDCIIQLTCETGYQRSNSIGKDYFHCINKTWNPPIPREFCIRGDVVGGTTTPSSPTGTGCVLPDSSPVRKYCQISKDCKKCDNLNRKCHIPPGSKVYSARVGCDAGYALNISNNAVVCDNGEWAHPIPECHKLCPSLQREAEYLKLTCQFRGEEVDCSERPSLPGTIASFRCQSGYSEIEQFQWQDSYRKHITCEEDGRWSRTFPQCTLNCGLSGLEVSKFTPTIINGSSAHIGFFPWHAGLYLQDIDDGRVKWNHICGGSLITNRLVLTAAHCVEKIKDIKTMRIAVGKYYQSWENIEPNEEKSEVLNITYPKHFQYNSPQAFDIALVVLKTKIKFGKFVMPVCLTEEADVIQNSVPHYVVGWGRTSPAVNAPTSEKLLYNTVRIGSREECERIVKPTTSFEFDKICAVNNTEAITQKGDSGGGLTAMNERGRHYIVAVVSSKIREVALFTMISTHKKWLYDNISKLSN